MGPIPRRRYSRRGCPGELARCPEHHERLPQATGNLVFDGKTIDINFNRLNDEAINTSFDLIRTNSDPAVRKKAAENINMAFGDNAYDLWRWRTIWAVGYCKTCGGVLGQKSPAGDFVQDFPTGLVADMGALTKG